MKKKRISRRSFLKQAGAGALAAPVLSNLMAGPAAYGESPDAPAPGFPMIQGGASRKRNVLFIATDDCCCRLGIYGNPIVKTPNLERLAKASVRFDRAYCQYPWCSPSRTSLMTGLAPDTTRVYDLRTHFRAALPDVVTLPQAFLNNGYFTARAGKIYHYGNPDQIGTSGLDDPPSWNESVNPAGVDHVKEEALLTNFTPQNRPKAKGRAGMAALLKQLSGGRGADCWPRGGDPEGAEVAGGDGWGASIAMYESTSSPQLHTDYLVADAAIAMLEKRRMQPDDPWFLGVGFYKPHVPWIVPSEYFDMYPLQDIQATPFNPDEMHIAPPWAYITRTPNYGMTTDQCRRAIRAYYSAATFLDSNVGRVLDALHRLGLAENTTVVFWADHGWQLGEHGQWEKQTLFEPAARVPLMIGGAGVSAQGQVCYRTVEHLDLYPTLVDMCSLRGAPSNLHGQSLVPLLSSPNASWERPAITQIYRPGNYPPPWGWPGIPPGGIMGYSIRNERYRYTFWKEDSEGEELYDYRVDPRELRNLATDSGAAGVKATLRADLERICRQRGMAHAPGALQT
ncbi:MAG: sulfatase [Acidobacteriaceae bacterium]